jgi:hypothetical protein
LLELQVDSFEAERNAEENTSAMTSESFASRVVDRRVVRFEFSGDAA